MCLIKKSDVTWKKLNPNTVTLIYKYHHQHYPAAVGNYLLKIVHLGTWTDSDTALDIQAEGSILTLQSLG